MSKEERLKRLQDNLNKKSTSSWESVDRELSLQITWFEREMGFPIHSEYPLMKFQQQYDDLIIILEKEAEANKRARKQ